MDAKKFLLGMSVILLFLFLSGCSDQSGTTTEKTFDNIEFDSDVVRLDAANLKFIKDEEEFAARSVELKYRLHNPQNRSITAVVDVVFYDENGRDVYSEEGYEINLPSEYTENSFNTITYDGSMVRVIDNVRITAYEQVE